MSMIYTDQVAWDKACQQWLVARSAFEAAENKRIASLYQQRKLNAYALRWFELGNLVFAIWLYGALSARWLDWPDAAGPVSFVVWLGGGIFWVWFLAIPEYQFQRRTFDQPKPVFGSAAQADQNNATAAQAEPWEWVA